MRSYSAERLHRHPRPLASVIRKILKMPAILDFILVEECLDRILLDPRLTLSSIAEQLNEGIPC